MSDGFRRVHLLDRQGRMVRWGSRSI